MKKQEWIGFQTRYLSKMIGCRLHQKEMESGADTVTATHGWIIGYLWEHREEEIYQKDLEREFHMARSSITGIVQIMENNGYIKRTLVAHDARLKKIELTPRGVEFHKNTHRNMEELELEVKQGISPEDLNTYYRVTEQMKKNLQMYLDAGSDQCTSRE